MAKVVKKAQTGTTASSTPKISLRTGQFKRLGRLAAKNPEKAEKVGKRMVERRTRVQRGKAYLDKNAAKMYPETPGIAKKGAKVAKKVVKAVKAVKAAKKAVAPVMKKGGKMKSCRGGCY
jgi:hypothetical protein